MKVTARWASAACAVAALVCGAAAASYDDIAPIEVYGQHFFYTNNGSQLYGFIALELADAILTTSQLPQGRGVPAKLPAERHFDRKSAVHGSAC
jgi:hypothetical protein